MSKASMTEVDYVRSQAREDARRARDAIVELRAVEAENSRLFAANLALQKRIDELEGRISTS